MVFHAFASYPSQIHRYADRYVWKLDHVLFEEALRLIPQDKYLRDKSQDYSLARLMEAVVPKGERILGVRGVPYAYSNREFLVNYQAALNQTMIDSLNIGWVLDFQPTVIESFKFPEHTARRFRILQTGKVEFPEVQWSVHEMRFFRKGVEVTRQPEWRLRAWPNPWEVQLAFDGSLSTRWRTWETARPGDYLDVDFGKDEAVDEVRLDTSPDFYAVQSQIEAMDTSGKWALLAKDPAVAAADRSNYSLRLAATYEMKARGLHYLLVGDDYPGAGDISDDPSAWGLTEVVSAYGVRLYKVTQ